MTTTRDYVKKLSDTQLAERLAREQRQARKPGNYNNSFRDEMIFEIKAEQRERLRQRR